ARHALDACRDCLARHLVAQVERRGIEAVAPVAAAADDPGDEGEGAGRGLACPVPSCGHPYSDAELRALAGEDAYARIDRLRLLAALACLPGFVWCARPECPAGQIAEEAALAEPSVPGGGRRVRCEDCGFDTCARCGIAWHGARVPCAAAARRHADSDAE